MALALTCATGAGFSGSTAGATPKPVIRPPVALDAVACPSASACIAIGGAGGVMVSRTGGNAWKKVTVPTKRYLYGIACSNSVHCVAVGDAGTALVTRTGGRTWSLGHTGVGVPLSSVTCSGGGRCDAVGDGDTVIVTRDGGLHWRKAFAGFGVLNGVACSSTTHCVAVTSSAVQSLLTTDGNSWAAGTLPFSPLDGLSPLNAIACSGTSCVAGGGHGLLARSTDGGTGWSTEQPVTSQALEAATCPSATRCVVVGEAGTVLTTNDGGSTWNAVPPPTAETLLGVSCASVADCVAVGSGGTAVTSTDGGSTWSVRAGRPAPNPGVPVLVVGDSFAHTLAMGLARDAPAYGVTIIDGSLDGCGLARGSPILTGGPPLSVTGPCAPDGPGWPAQYQADVATDHPALSLLVLGPWDLTTRPVDGQWRAAGQPGYDDYYRGQLISAVRILTAGGGRVAVTTAPEVWTSGPERCMPAGAGAGAATKNCPTEQQRVQALDAVVRQVAAELPGQVQVIDVGHRLSPHGTFTAAVDRVVVRAADGVHMSEPGGEWLTPWLVPRLVAAAR